MRQSGSPAGPRFATVREAALHVPSFKVVDLHPATNCGNIRAFASVQLGPLVIHRVRLIDTQDGRPAWVAPPQETYQKEGRTCYRPLVDFPPHWKDALTLAVVTAYQAKQQEAA